MAHFSVICFPFILLMVAFHFIQLFFATLFRMKRSRNKIWKQLYAIDVYANSLLGGHHKETISSRMGHLLHTDRCVFCKWTCKLLDLIDKDHCKKSMRDRDSL